MQLYQTTLETAYEAADAGVPQDSFIVLILFLMLFFGSIFAPKRSI